MLPGEPPERCPRLSRGPSLQPLPGAWWQQATREVPAARRVRSGGGGQSLRLPRWLLLGAPAPRPQLPRGWRRWGGSRHGRGGIRLCPGCCPGARRGFGSGRGVTWGCGGPGRGCRWHPQPGSPLLPQGTHLLGHAGRALPSSVLLSSPRIRGCGSAPRCWQHRPRAAGYSHEGRAQVWAPAERGPSRLDVPVLLRASKGQAGVARRAAGLALWGFDPL